MPPSSILWAAGHRRQTCVYQTRAQRGVGANSIDAALGVLCRKAFGKSTELEQTSMCASTSHMELWVAKTGELKGVLREPMCAVKTGSGVVIDLAVQHDHRADSSWNSDTVATSVTGGRIVVHKFLAWQTALKTGPQMTVRVTTPTTSHEMRIAASATVNELALAYTHKVDSEDSKSEDMQRFALADAQGKELPSTATLASVGIVDGSTVAAVLTQKLCVTYRLDCVVQSQDEAHEFTKVEWLSNCELLALDNKGICWMFNVDVLSEMFKKLNPGLSALGPADKEPAITPYLLNASSPQLEGGDQQPCQKIVHGNAVMPDMAVASEQFAEVICVKGERQKRKRVFAVSGAPAANDVLLLAPNSESKSQCAFRPFADLDLDLGAVRWLGNDFHPECASVLVTMSSDMQRVRFWRIVMGANLALCNECTGVGRLGNCVPRLMFDVLIQGTESEQANSQGSILVASDGNTVLFSRQGSASVLFMRLDLQHDTSRKQPCLKLSVKDFVLQPAGGADGDSEPAGVLGLYFARHEVETAKVPWTGLEPGARLSLLLPVDSADTCSETPSTVSVVSVDNRDQSDPTVTLAQLAPGGLPAGRPPVVLSRRFYETKANATLLTWNADAGLLTTRECTRWKVCFNAFETELAFIGPVGPHSDQRDSNASAVWTYTLPAYGRHAVHTQIHQIKARVEDTATMARRQVREWDSRLQGVENQLVSAIEKVRYEQISIQKYVDETAKKLTEDTKAHGERMYGEIAESKRVLEGRYRSFFEEVTAYSAQMGAKCQDTRHVLREELQAQIHEYHRVLYEFIVRQIQAGTQIEDSAQMKLAVTDAEIKQWLQEQVRQETADIAAFQCQFAKSAIENVREVEATIVQRIADLQRSTKDVISQELHTALMQREQKLDSQAAALRDRVSGILRGVEQLGPVQQQTVARAQQLSAGDGSAAAQRSVPAPAPAGVLLEPGMELVREAAARGQYKLMYAGAKDSTVSWGLTSQLTVVRRAISSCGAVEAALAELDADAHVFLLRDVSVDIKNLREHSHPADAAKFDSAAQWMSSIASGYAEVKGTTTLGAATATQIGQFAAQMAAIALVSPLCVGECITRLKLSKAVLNTVCPA
eukprot:TRINITY_DN1073_c8_g1_i1.p1 TRINITY_DN1073_c8_g1~~TRINITY_DN1073_c8_g1_i1.p1  ORF type:complete len:1146 (+),score=210.87 TRINITY_DN1073_c8_g1_i1:108-3440(+)